MPINNKIYFITTIQNIDNSINKEIIHFYQLTNGNVEVIKQVKEYENINKYTNDFSLIEENSNHEKNIKIEIDKLYFNIPNFNYLLKETKFIFHESTKNAFSIADFEVFWEEICLNKSNQIFTKDYFLSEKFEESEVMSNLEIYFNFFINLYLNSKDIYSSNKYQNPNTYKIAEQATDIYNHFREACNEIIKLIILFGYSFDNTDFTKKQQFKIIKSDYKNLIEKNNHVKKDLKSLLLEISISSSLQELEKNLDFFYPYLEVERDKIREMLGENIKTDIFLLMNKIIRHKIKEQDFLYKININKQEKQEIILWLKDIIIFYFICCKQVYPKTTIQKIKNKK